MKKLLSFVVLAVMGAMNLGCSNTDDPIGNPDIINGGEEVTLTATISFEGGEAQTRALDAQGHKTFAVGDQIAVLYENLDDDWRKAETNRLTADDITDDGMTATITVTLKRPKLQGPLKYVYPATMGDWDGSVNYAALKEQDGTLASLAANLDVALYEGSFDNGELPNVKLINPLCIGEFSIINDDNDITGNIRMMTVNDGTNFYIVRHKPVAGPIYVAMLPTDKPLQFYAHDYNNNYRRSVSGKTLAAGNMYPVNLAMPTDKRTALERLTGDYKVKDGETLTGVLIGDCRILITSKDATVTLDGVDINSTCPDVYGGDFETISSWPEYLGINGIGCFHNTTLILADGSDNKVVAGAKGYAGISIEDGYTLTIRGNGSLTAKGKASGYFNGAGIGGYFGHCGNIVIESGNITAQGPDYAAGIGSGYGSWDGIKCGDITISGGNVTAQGGKFAAGIGTGYNDSHYKTTECGRILISGGTVSAAGGEKAAGIGTGMAQNTGNKYKSILITNGVTSVKATGYPYSIGIGENGSSSGKVIIGCTLDSDGKPVGGNEGMISTSPYTYQP